MNAKVSLGLDRLNVAQKIDFANVVIAAFASSPYFAGVVSTAALETARDEMEARKTERDQKQAEAKSGTELLDQQETLFDREFNNLVLNAQLVAQGDAAILESGALPTFEPGKAPPVGPLDMVENLIAEPGEAPGEVALNWNPLQGADRYQVYLATNPLNNSWAKVATPSQSKLLLEDLKTGTKYWVIVTGLGTAGEGPPSEIASSVAR